MEKIKVVAYSYVCDECGKDIMRYTGNGTEYGTYTHVCDKCSYTLELPCIYPKYEHKRLF